MSGPRKQRKYRAEQSPGYLHGRGQEAAPNEGIKRITRPRLTHDVTVLVVAYLTLEEQIWNFPGKMRDSLFNSIRDTISGLTASNQRP
jgi:hypothetical protein